MIITIIALGFIVFLHEAGHFLAAKAVGVSVDEFSVGFGKILLRKKVNGTDYSLKVFLLGGYVKLEDAFRDRRSRTRIFVGLAGPTANLLFAFITFSVVSFVGLPELTTKIGTVFAGHAAAKAGILPGDRVIAVDGRPVSRWMEMTSAINDGKKRNLRVTVRRGQDNLDVVVRPELQEGRGVVGIKASGESVAVRYGMDSAIEGWRLVMQNLKSSVDLFLQLAAFKSTDVAGPVRILALGAEQVKFGLVSMFNFVSILSVSFFIFNMIPIPVLDGGLIFIALLEAVIGRQINRKLEQTITKVGLAIIVGLMMFIFLSDLAKLII
jgi:regulator of sigma E protease